MSQEPQDCRRATLGRVADLVLLRANPLSDIRATREIEAVESATREDGDNSKPDVISGLTARGLETNDI